MNPKLTANFRADRELKAQIEKQNQSPFTRADEIYLLEVLTECRKKLESAFSTAQGYSRLPKLQQGISEAITGIHQAAAVVLEPETYIEQKRSA